MTEIHTQKKLVNKSAFVKRQAAASDCKQFVTAPAKVFVDGVLAALYLDISAMDTVALVDAVRSVKFATADRTGGMPSSSRVFGYMPRRPMGRGDFCAAASLDRDFPQQAKTIGEFVGQLETFYAAQNPAVYAHHARQAAKILPEYSIHKLFSSGIVNKDNPLPYHLDGGNIPGCWSLMPVFKKDIDGGHLACPEIDLCFELADHTALMFDGQRLVHGVTPFTKTAPDGYRFSVVYYTMKQLWACLPFDQEIQRARVNRTAVEARSAEGKVHHTIEKYLAKRNAH
jgi:hypothetical protein